MSQEYPHKPVPTDRREESIKFYVEWLLRECVEIPAAYWPQLVNTVCQRLLDQGEEDATVRCIYRRVVRELRLDPSRW